ncbi:MAG: hypothetical protein JWM34_950 [Ilumatobacteraceae bacterium]|nr:hypothetical protein [Ilumatobacteraceae bacterium]
MRTSLEDRLADVARSWDLAAPPITADEVMRAAATASPHDTHGAVSLLVPMGAIGPRPSSRRRLRMAAIYGAAAAVLIAGVIIITSRHADAPPAQGPTPATTPPATDVSPAFVDPVPASTDPPASDPSPSSAPTTTASTEVSTSEPSDPSTPPATAAQLAEVRTAALEALQRLPSYRATVTKHDAQIDANGAATQDTTSTNTITVEASGELWATGDLFTWTSYDPTTGITLDEYTIDGVTHRQEIDGWTDSSTALGMIVGGDPATDLDAGGADATSIADTLHLGRPAWTLTEHSVETYGAKLTLDSVTVVDKDTGVVVQRSEHQTAPDGSVTTTGYDFTSFEVGVDLPPDYPGHFPDGAEVERSGDDTVFPLPDPATAVVRFGHPLYAPRGASVDHARITVTTSIGTDAEGGPLPSANATITFPTGFLRPTITFETPSFPAPPDPTAPRLTSGALAGDAYVVQGDQVTVLDYPVTITIDFPFGHSLDIANSLVAISS